MNRHAFSLMELLLVMGLLAGLGALSIPVLTMNFGQGGSLSQDVQQVAQKMRAARQMALDYSTPVCVQIATSHDQASFYRQRDPNQRETIVLRAGHQFIYPLPQHSGVQVIFREDGSSTGALLQIRSDIEQMRVRIERSTGQITVEKTL